jgi:formylglycine-generating enzyme required for sulfatase activity
MLSDLPTVGILQRGGGRSGSYSYSVYGSYNQAANCPVFDVTWGDAARFCNWLQNGQPVGAEGPGTTETGAYTLNGNATDWMTVNRNVGATYFLPSANEWYKAAYYNPANGRYWLYPTQSNTAPTNVLSGTGTNNANFCNSSGAYTDPTNYLTPVGAFAASPSPYGTYDMSGDVWQWNEARIAGDDYSGMYGGCWYLSTNWFEATNHPYYYPPTTTYDMVGFRVASSTPEPSSIMLLVCGAVSLFAYAWRWRR